MDTSGYTERKLIFLQSYNVPDTAHHIAVPYKGAGYISQLKLFSSQQ